MIISLESLRVPLQQEPYRRQIDMDRISVRLSLLIAEKASKYMYSQGSRYWGKIQQDPPYFFDVLK